MKKLIILPLTLFSIFLYGQATDEDVKPTNYTVPSSIAFDLLDVSPTEVHKPGLTKDFKFDWLFNDNGLKPNIAFEAQPIWLLANRNKSLYEYQNSDNKINRYLSTLKLSLGTTNKDSMQSLAYGFSLNLYTEVDPLMDSVLIEIYDESTTITDLEDDLSIIKFNIETETDETRLKELQKEQTKKEREIENAKIDKEKGLEEKIEEWEKLHWNSTIVDIGFGQVFNYDSGKLDSLNLRSQGYSAWLSGVFGIGKNVMVNGMLKYSNIGSIDYFEVGGNIRYGSNRANVFIEYLYSSQEDRNNNLAYGIDYKLPNNLVLQASLKTQYNEEFNLKSLIPTIDFNYQLSQ